jgi:polyferredoxin
MNQLRKKIALLRGVIIFGFFLLTAILVAYLRTQFTYFFLFSGIGLVAGITEFAIAANPSSAQIIRRASLNILAGTLFILALVIGINFQFSQIFVDLYAGIITGALIQFVAARLILPFFFGNIFCSRACWDGAVFETFAKFAKKIPEKENSPSPYRSITTWLFLLLIISVASIFGVFGKLSPGGNQIRWMFIFQNLLIISVGILLSRIIGQRSYCRNICPFLTISGIISPFSLFKISPVNHEKCIKCGKCTKKCSMGINVEEYIRNNRRIDHPDCIMCEACVSICPNECIMVSMKKVLKGNRGNRR